MAITHLIHKNNLSELNYDKYPKPKSHQSRMSIEPIEIGMWEWNGRI